ncbi:ABC transporter ATP-binding protein [Catenuloplanes japonicus]|uniref:ABC transporter ATP-binding protein n=1 Tax=Catenuloplanes japonicus TaxID=33876 RepID=UPI000524C9AF|nr:ATP-binding cassette domain-containing protein [Catenuloplanes japonicus]
MTALVTVRGLTARAGDRTLVDDVSFDLVAGRITALVGPSGSGKTTTALALHGEHHPGVRLSGRVTVDGREIIGADGVLAGAAAVRGRIVAHLTQHPGAALNPARRVGGVLREIARAHRGGDDTAVTDALRQARLDDGRALRRRFPHQFSGGQRQRVVLAEALACGPRVLVLDEPTTGLDAVTKAYVLTELTELARAGMAILLLSHDLPVVRALADQVVSLRAGRVEAAGTVGETLPAAKPWAFAAPGGADAVPSLEVFDLEAWHRRARVLHGVSLTLAPGRCEGLVGASGSGKTTLARCVAGLHDRMTGRVLLDGRPLPPLRRRDRELRRRVQYVWQEVRGSFEPHRPVLAEVARTAVRLRGLTATAAEHEALVLLDRLGVGEGTARRDPAGLSGGELQRAAVARALLAEPDVLICDEVTTALDETAARAVRDVLAEARRDRGVAMLLITHDLATACADADHLRVIDDGRIVDSGPPSRLVAAPGSETTALLLRAAAPAG